MDHICFNSKKNQLRLQLKKYPHYILEWASIAGMQNALCKVTVTKDIKSM